MTPNTHPPKCGPGCGPRCSPGRGHTGSVSGVVPWSPSLRGTSPETPCGRTTPLVVPSEVPAPIRAGTR